MTQLPVGFHPAVEEDLAEIYAHYREFDVVLPERFEARLYVQVERLGNGGIDMATSARRCGTPIFR